MEARVSPIRAYNIIRPLRPLHQHKSNTLTLPLKLEHIDPACNTQLPTCSRRLKTK